MYCFSLQTVHQKVQHTLVRKIFIGQTMTRSKCPHCGLMFTHVNQHIRYKHIKNNKIYECPSCPKKFVINRDLLKHYRIHTGKEPFRCHICDKGFVQNNLLQGHLNKIHYNIKGYKCEKCTKSCYSESGLLKHTKRVHMKESHLQCPYCKYSAAYKSSMTRHIDAKHPDRSGTKTKYKCKKCTKSYYYKSSLKRHTQRVHMKEAGEWKLNKIVKSKIHVKQHVDMESEHMVSNGTNLKQTDVLENQHVIGLNKYICVKCKKAYKTEEKLRKHGKKRHSTTSGNKTNPAKSRLLQHEELIERGKHPEISTKETDRAHVTKKQNKIKEYSCWRCKKTYKTIEKLDKHSSKKHAQMGAVALMKTGTENDVELDKIVTSERQVKKCDDIETEYVMEIESKRKEKSVQKYQGPKEAKKHSCSKCAKSYYTELKLRKHERKCHGVIETGFESGDCGDKKFDSIEPEPHIKSNTAEGTDYDDVIKIKGYSSGSVDEADSALQNHDENHAKKAANNKVETVKFLCKKCGKIFKSKDKLKRHKEKHRKHRVNEKSQNEENSKPHHHNSLESVKYEETRTEKSVLFCTKCQKMFVNAKHLRWHLLTHAERHTCTRCDVSFPTIFKLQDHNKLHDVQSKGPSSFDTFYCPHSPQCANVKMCFDKVLLEAKW